MIYWYPVQKIAEQIAGQLSRLGYVAEVERTESEFYVATDAERSTVLDVATYVMRPGFSKTL